MKKQVMTKKEKVMNHLVKHGKISSKEAKSRYGVAKLRNVIYALRKQGVLINSVEIPTKKGTIGRKPHKYVLEVNN